MLATVPSLFDLATTSGTRTGQLGAADAFERDGALVVLMDLPGVTQDELELLVDDHTLTVRAERRMGPDPTDRVLRTERPYGTTSRTFRVRRALDPDSATAQLSDGVLTVTVSYADSTGGPRRIQVTAPEDEQAPAA